MLKAVGKNAFWLVISSLLIFPVIICGQDLGSTNGIFGNPKTKKSNPAPSEKISAAKTAPVKKAPAKTVAPKATARNNSTRTVSKPKPQPVRNTAAKIETAVNQPVKQPIKQPERNDIVITVGKQSTGDYEELFDQSIDEGNTARDDRNYSMAEVAYRRAQSLNPRDFRAVYGMGNLYSDQQRWEEAEKSYRQAIDLDPDGPETYVALSFVLTQPLVGTNLSDRYSEAEKMARKAIQLDANNPIAFDQLGTALELNGKIGDETQSAYRQAIKIEPNFALAYAHNGRLLRKKGLAAESNAAYKDAIRLANDVPTMILVADVMQSQQRYAESEDLLRKALSYDSKNPTALYLLGRALTIRGAFDEAEALLKKSVSVSPNSFVSYAMLGSLYARRGIYAEAERVLMQATKVIAPTEKKRLAVEFELIGDGLMRVGKNSDAARVYRQAITLDNEKPDLTAKLNKAEKS